MAKGKKLKKPLKKYDTNRRGPDKSQQEKIERIANPRTPEDLLLALQNPSSPAYKERMNLIAANMETVAIFNYLVNLFLIEQRAADQREKDEIFKEMLAQEIAQHSHVKQYDEKAKIPEAKIVLEEEKFRARLEERALVIDSLKKEVTSIRDDIEKLKEKSAKNNLEWQKTTERQCENFLARMALPENGSLQFVSSSGQVIDQNDPRYENFSKPAIADIDKLVSMMSASYAMQQSKVETNNARPAESVAENVKQEASEKDVPLAPAKPPEPPKAPAPPPLPKRPPISRGDMSKNIGGMNAVFKQMLDIANARDTDNLQDFFKALDNNKHINRFISKDSKERIHEMQENITLIEKAFELNDEKTTKQNELDGKEKDLASKEIIQNAELKVYEQNFGSLEDRKKQSIDEPAATVSAKSTGQT